MTDMERRIYNAFRPADILLPPKDADMSRYSMIACDQFTSEPEYWHEADKYVGGAPSTLRCILPEAFLSTASKPDIDKINGAMRDYLYNYFLKIPSCMIYIRRRLRCGSVRAGIVGMLDLDEYDYGEGSSSLVRATEKTVLERIPPRVAIRRDAPVELPHVMILIDDPRKNVIEPITAEGAPIYDFDLFGEGGHLTGFKMSDDEILRARTAIASLARHEECRDASGSAPMIFAVGDGNHSLASAKECWEHIKTRLNDAERESHPARFALCEIVNLHDASLVFEPIYRLAADCDADALISELHCWAKNCRGDNAPQKIEYISARGCGEIIVDAPPHMLAVGTLQLFLDDYIRKNKNVKLDYIHGIDTVRKLSSAEGAVGFVFDGMKKDELFKSVSKNGALPRKTFSMGEARDKRYYTEARRIKTDAELEI